jgi:hypothetical protein
MFLYKNARLTFSIPAEEVGISQSNRPLLTPPQRKRLHQHRQRQRRRLAAAEDPVDDVPK